VGGAAGSRKQRKSFSSSPWSFCRIFTATCEIAQCWSGVVVDIYIDDFLIVDVDNAPVKERRTDRIWASSAQFCLNRIHTMLGMEFESNKHKTAAPNNVILGVEINLQDFLSEGKVSFAPTKKRCEKILLQSRECERRGLIRSQVDAFREQAISGQLRCHT
jgi:hypothetical protein